jgi:hypothetical protein
LILNSDLFCEKLSCSRNPLTTALFPFFRANLLHPDKAAIIRYKMASALDQLKATGTVSLQFFPMAYSCCDG